MTHNLWLTREFFKVVPVEQFFVMFSVMAEDAALRLEKKIMHRTRLEKGSKTKFQTKKNWK